MRIIGGKAKGHGLAMVKSKGTRPTSDRVKESMFNILHNDLTGFKVLDLFAGVGNIGLESLSRGAASVTFVDMSQECIKIIKRNLEHTKLNNGKIKIIKSDFKKVLKNSTEQYDFIFLDPPYATNYAGIALELIRSYNLLANEGIVVVEHDKHTTFNNWEPYRQKKYGQTYLSFFCNEGEQK
ncbi:16S rRNA (guanine(966)-N(2))-methyltransferase RsmD [Clostridium sp. 'deep sea']|uniref:16S rRNA (guanine(966)-N(2))-methyltransferase RsmD n=1 Tax=Clostridium sp. 'deep sea' TaxID=2779445 RepID=UPI00189658F9|nr:16S rRNA (guanine(966)-N(2))-methyltransferase RsmD [Clostridium sp. 'deep sea']QOR36179.1 16S rRNA (guanine(966)-N(2))-methyltransferase RsmD [Clostridium sp. 'deep sea']